MKELSLVGRLPRQWLIWWADRWTSCRYVEIPQRLTTVHIFWIPDSDLQDSSTMPVGHKYLSTIQLETLVTVQWQRWETTFLTTIKQAHWGVGCTTSWYMKAQHDSGPPCVPRFMHHESFWNVPVYMYDTYWDLHPQGDAWQRRVPYNYAGWMS